MTIVPKNKRVYIGARRFVEGDILPPYIMLEIPAMTKKEAEAKAEENIKTRRYKSRSGGVSVVKNDEDLD